MPYRALGPGSLVASRFRLEDLLEEHSGARFWRATDLTLARNVAIHVISAEDPRAPAVLTAARTSALVSDPHILRVLDAFQEGRVVHVVHEWGSGVSLDRMLADDTVEPRRAAWLVREVADGITAAHQHGVAHGRLLPENVMVTDAGSVKLIGFVVDAVLHGRPRRTAGGGPPPSEHESDVTNLGGLLYAALTGRWPGFPPSVVPSAPLDHGHTCRPRQVRPGVPRELDTLCDQVLHRDPRGGRFESAAQVSAALAGYLGEPAAGAALPGSGPTLFLDPAALGGADANRWRSRGHRSRAGSDPDRFATAPPAGGPAGRDAQDLSPGRREPRSVPPGGRPDQGPDQRPDQRPDQGPDQRPDTGPAGRQPGDSQHPGAGGDPAAGGPAPAGRAGEEPRPARPVDPDATQADVFDARPARPGGPPPEPFTDTEATRAVPMPHLGRVPGAAPPTGEPAAPAGEDPGPGGRPGGADPAHRARPGGDDDPPPAAGAVDADSRRAAPSGNADSPTRAPGTGMGAGMVPPDWGPDRADDTGSGPVVPAADAPGSTWLRLASLIGLVCLVLFAVIVAYTVGTRGGSEEPGSAAPSARGGGSAVVSPASVVSFDPDQSGGGAPEENPDQVPLATDGDPSTAWHTLDYRDGPVLAPYKSGVGLLIDLGKETEVGSVTVTLQGSPYALRLLAAPKGAARPTGTDGLATVATADDAGGRVRLAPRSAVTTRYLVVWLTALPRVDGGYRGGISEVVVRT